MNKIEIDFKDFTGSCMLIPNYNVEAEILEFTSSINRKWEYGIDCNGNLIIDIDSDFKIANCDLLIPKKLWKKSEALPLNIISKNKDYIDLSFRKSTIKYKSFNIAIDVFIFKDKLYVLLDNPTNVNINKLSDKCDVLSFDNELKGFILENF